MTTSGRPIPRMRGWPLIGNSLVLAQDPLLLLRRAAELGDVVRVDLPGPATYVVTSPEVVDGVLWGQHKHFIKDSFTRRLGALLGNGLLTSDGEFWKRQRRLVQPAFHREQIASYTQTMVDAALDLVNSWHDGDQRDIHADFMRVTLDIVARTLFSTDVGRVADRVSEALEVAMERFGAWTTYLVPFYDRIPTALNRRFWKASGVLDGVVYDIIRERRRERAEQHHDLLSMLLSARDEDGGVMSDQQVRDEVMILFLAGHETTALALTYAVCLLSKHPEVLSLARECIRTVVGDRAPTLVDVPKLRLIEYIAHETMRLYPPAWSIGREATQDVEIDGYHFARGEQIWIAQCVTHRDPRHFANPEVFDPMRWEGDLLKKLPRSMYLPFGGGPRVCIGNQFAMTELVLILSTVLQRAEIEIPRDFTITVDPSVTLRPKGTVRGRVRLLSSVSRHSGENSTAQ